MLESPRPPARLLLEIAGLYLAFVALLHFLDGDAFLKRTHAFPVAVQIALHVGLALGVGLGGTWLLTRRDPSPVRTLGLLPIPLRDALAYGAVGFVGAYVCSTVLGTSYLIASRTPFGTLLETRGPVLELLASTPLWMVLPLSLVVGLYEEIVFRGFVLGRLREALASTQLEPLRRDAVAVGVSAVLFGLLHAYQGAYGVFQTAGAGLALGGLAVWRRSLWPSVVAHAGIDTFGLFALHVLLPLLKNLLHSLPTPAR